MQILKQKDLKKYRERWISNKDYDPLVQSKIINSVVDHNHKTGLIRGVIDRETNQYIGKLEQNFIRFIHWKFPDVFLPDFLKRIADYLMQDYRSNPIHPVFVQKQIKKFSRLSLDNQKSILLKECGYLQVGKDKKENTKLYRSFLMRESNIYKT